jgi:hypothetical protein
MATTWDPVDREKVAFHEAGHAVVAPARFKQLMREG